MTEARYTREQLAKMSRVEIYAAHGESPDYNLIRERGYEGALLSEEEYLVSQKELEEVWGRPHMNKLTQSDLKKPATGDLQKPVVDQMGEAPKPKKEPLRK
jgi:hypothetical protein